MIERNDMKHSSVTAFLRFLESEVSWPHDHVFLNRYSKDASALLRCPAHFGHVTQSSVENTGLKA